MALRNFREEDSLGLGIALCALLFALTFRALLPSGYMLEAQPDGVELVLCGSGGLRTIVVDADGRPIDKPAHPEDRQAEAVCALVGMAAIAPATAGPAAPSGTLWTIRPVEIPPALPRDMRNPRGPPPLRGPPVLMI